MTNKINTSEIDWSDPDAVLKNQFELWNIDKEDWFYVWWLDEIIKDFNNNDFYLLDKNIDFNKWLYELSYNWNIIWRWNFILWSWDILIKYIEKFTDNNGFWTLMYIDFLARLKNEWITIIRSEIKSPEVVSIYEKLIARWILSDTTDGYIIN